MRLLRIRGIQLPKAIQPLISRTGAWVQNWAATTWALNLWTPLPVSIRAHTSLSLIYTSEEATVPGHFQYLAVDINSQQGKAEEVPRTVDTWWWVTYTLIGYDIGYEKVWVCYTGSVLGCFNMVLLFPITKRSHVYYWIGNCNIHIGPNMTAFLSPPP